MMNNYFRSIILLMAIIYSVGIQIELCNAQSTLEIVCSNPGGEIPVLTTKQVVEFTEQLQNPNTKVASCDKYLDSFIELNKIIQNRESLKDVCSESMYESIRAYHLKFISYYSPEASKNDLIEREKAGLENIPESLIDYFVDLASKIGVECSINVIKEYAHQLKDVDLEHDELEDMKKVRLEARKYLAEDLTKDTKHFIRNHFDEIEILPKNVIEQHKSQIHVALPNNRDEDIFLINQLCLIKYGKVYEDLFSPMIRLNNLGYAVHLLKLDEQDALESKGMKHWITVIETCEALKRIDFIIDNSKKEPTLIEDNEAASLKSKLGSGATEPFLESTSIKPIDYKHVPVSINIDADIHIPRARVAFDRANESNIKKRSSLLTTIRRTVKGRK